MIIIKKKKTNIIARILALIGVICVIFTAFALPSFAWGNVVPGGNASQSEAYSLFPITDIELYRESANGSYKIVSNYSSQNYLSLNNRSNYSSMFPQVQSNGVYKTTVDVLSPFDGATDYYRVETLFDPSYYYDENTFFELELFIKDTMYLNDLKTRELYSEVGSSGIAQYMPAYFIDKSVNTPLEGPVDMNFELYVCYSATVIYNDYGQEGKELVKTFKKENVPLIPYERENYLYYYLFEPLFEDVGLGVNAVYVDFLEIYAINWYKNYPSQGISNTYAYYNSEEPYLTDYRTIEEMLYNKYFDSTSFDNQIAELNDKVLDLENVNAEHVSTILELQEGLSDEIYLREFWTSEYNNLNKEYKALEKELLISKDTISMRDEEIKELESKNFELRNTTGAIEEFFDGISSALWNGLVDLSDIGYSYVDSDGNTQNVTVGNLITISVVGIVAFFVIKIIRGG